MSIIRRTGVNKEGRGSSHLEFLFQLLNLHTGNWSKVGQGIQSMFYDGLRVRGPPYFRRRTGFRPRLPYP